MRRESRHCGRLLPLVGLFGRWSGNVLPVATAAWCSAGAWHGSCINLAMQKPCRSPIFALALFLSLLFSGSVLAGEWQSHADIQAAAAATVRAQWAVSGGRVDVVADELDRRIRLPACDQALAVTVPFERKQSSRVTTQVRCDGARPWKLFVPVRLAIFQQVLVAAHALPRDSLLTADDISLTEMDTGRMDYGYLVEASDAVGQRLRRPLAAGEPIAPGNLEIPPMVKRGQRVTLEAQTGGLTVRMAGVAKADGIKGQIIEVENLNSGRDVQAVVRSAKSVEVLLN